MTSSPSSTPILLCGYHLPPVGEWIDTATQIYLPNKHRVANKCKTARTTSPGAQEAQHSALWVSSSIFCEGFTQGQHEHIPWFRTESSYWLVSSNQNSSKLNGWSRGLCPRFSRKGSWGRAQGLSGVLYLFWAGGSFSEDSSHASPWIHQLHQWELTSSVHPAPWTLYLYHSLLVGHFGQ